jgi:hypothetical protein
MPKLECEFCHKLINIEEKNFIIENKCYFHKKCYVSHIKKEKKAKFLPKFKKFSSYFTISLIILIVLCLFQDLSNLFSLFSIYILMVLSISFGIMTLILLFQLIRFK